MDDRYKKYIRSGDEASIPSRTLKRFMHMEDAVPNENEQVEINVTERFNSDLEIADSTIFDENNMLHEEENILMNEEIENSRNGYTAGSYIDDSFRENVFDIDECNFHIPNGRKPKNLQEYIESEEFFRPISTPVDKTVGELVLMINKFCKTECLSMTGRTNIVKLINAIFEEPVLPDSRYMIDKLLNPKCNAEYHAVCHECTSYIGKFENVDRSVKVCGVCNAPIDLSNLSNTNYFVLIDPSEQISNLIKVHESHYDAVVHNRLSDRNFIKDIIDGKEYRKFKSSLPEEDKYSYVTSIFNTDGAPKFECSQYSIWPIYLILNELPSQDRMQNVITCGLWFHKNKPEMSVFLNPFVDVINKLSSEGISCIIRNEERKIKLFVLVCCVDSVARAPIQGIKQFNGKFGCSWCLHPGVWSDGSMKYPLLAYIPESRQSEATIANMLVASPANPINGIKYPSPLMNLPSFHIIKGFVPDYMHCCLEGVARQFTEYYLQSMQLNSDEIKQLDLIMQNITVPHQISRLTRSLTSRGDWKAREWENFILYISVPLFSIKLSNKFLRHWQLFVESLYILLQQEIDIVELNRADRLLHEFVAKSEEYFGVKSITFNLHQMLHLCESVLNWGPLWAHSTFPFESANCELLRSIKCARGVTQQIVRFVNMNHSLLILTEHVYRNACELVKFYSDDILSLRVKNFLKIANTTYFGKGTHYYVPDNPLVANLNLSITNTKSFWKIVKNKCLYSSTLKLNKRSNNSFAQLVDGAFINIEYFLVDTETRREYTVFHSVSTSNTFGSICTKLHKIRRISDDLSIIPTMQLNNICVYVKIENNEYICPVPNLLYY